MRKVASLVTTILITILCYSAIDYYNIEHGKTQQKQKKKQHKATKEERTTTVVMNTLRPWEQCETAQRYIFLKKHKVASSALKTMFTNFERHAGLYSEPQLIRPQGGCYPARINAECLAFDGYEQIEGLKYHFRWNIDEINSLLAPNTIRITSIREPLSCFRSVYNYFYYGVKKSNPSCDMPCWHQPFYTFNGDRKFVPLGEFMDLLPEAFDTKVTRNFRARNYQAFEMGMDHLNDDDEYIRSSIEKLNTQFDLVILTEYFLESLVLLADILCIPYEVLYTPRRNSRDYEQDELTHTQMSTFKSFFKQDILLYDFFNKTLQEKIDVFGRQRMAYEIGQIKETFAACATNKKKCLFPRQKRDPPPRRAKKKMDPARFLRIVEDNYGTCDNPGSPYQKLKTRNFTAECEWTDIYLRRNFDL